MNRSKDSIEAFAPNKRSDLAIHSKKLGELEEWLNHCKAMSHEAPGQICLISGPTGSGKTAAVLLLAQEHNFKIQQWATQDHREFVSSVGNKQYCTRDSQIDALRSFLFRASRYNSLFEPEQKRLLLIEDIPDTILQSQTSFTSILKNFIDYGKAPLIFILADRKCPSLNKVFLDDVMNQDNIRHIKFNPIASTLMNKAVKRWCSLIAEQSYCDIYEVPSSSIVECITLSANGDIRNAIINLHFASLKGIPALKTEPVENLEKKKRQKKVTVDSIGRDESITMFHVIGRILNPKYTSANRLTHNPESLTNLVSTQSNTIVNFIHANFLEHFADISTVAKALEGISIADIIMRNYIDDSFAITGLDIATRTVMVSNTSPVGGWKPLQGPKRYDHLKSTLDNLSICAHQQNVSLRTHCSELKTYLKYISSTCNNGHYEV